QVTIVEHERKAVGHARLAEQAPRLPAGGLDVAAVAGELTELALRGGVGRAWHLHAADFLHDGDPRQRFRPVPAVDGQRGRAAHARIIPRLLLVVRHDPERAVPRALLDDDPGAER